jgi:FkbM family methyltransferase
MSKILRQLIKHAKRVANARRFGIRFMRRGTFELPEAISLNGKRVPLASPEEHGAKIDALACFVNDEYGLSSFRYAPRTILDIGANLGFFSMAARGYFPDATIHAYEPNPRIHSYVRANAASADFRLFPEAVGSANGEVFMVDPGDSNQAAVATSGAGAEVPQTSFRNAIHRLGGKVDLAKIDCEGAEWELFGCFDEWTKIRSLRIEYHLLSKWTFDDVVDRVCNQLRFRLLHHVSSGQWGTIWAERGDALAARQR